MASVGLFGRIPALPDRIDSDHRQGARQPGGLPGQQPEQLLTAKLKTANLDPGHEALPDVERVVKKNRMHWLEVRITLRGGSGFCRDDLLGWHEILDYAVGSIES